MKKNVVQDIVPPKKSIRNIEIEHKASRLENIEKVVKERPAKEGKISISRITTPKEAPPPPPPTERTNYRYEYEEPKKRGKWGFYIGIFALLLVVAFGISTFFKGAKVTITPKEDQKQLNDTFTAKKDASPNSLSFQTATLSKEVDKTLAATVEQQVNTKARGKIVVYNNTAEVVKLVATTRFETPEGLIFRLISPAVVPAKEVKAGKTTAGSLEVTVEADKVGANYNVGLKDFTLPGLKGDAKYSQVYGRSKTEMAGGYSGMQKTAPKEAVASADKDLENELRDTLSKGISAQIPENFILYAPSLNYKFDQSTQVPTSDGRVVVKKTGVATGIIFDKSALTRAILSKVMPDITGDMVKITSLSSLDFALATGTSFDPNTTNTFNFSLKGGVNVVWTIDENKLKSDLLGLSKRNATAILATYDTVKEAWIETYPFWNQTIPNDSKKVTLVNTLTP